MSNDSTITLADAPLFSTLAYAVGGDSIAWGLAQSGTTYQAAYDLSQAGWKDMTASLLTQFNILGSSDTGLNEFRVYVNSSHQVVFAFKGSDNVTNFVSDFLSSDQGYTQYNSIQAVATQLYNAMANNPKSPYYGTYTFFADGHSLGGGMAQTFALQNNISGFGQNSLPIAPDSQTHLGWSQGSFANQLAHYSGTFQELNLEGDLATALYHTTFTGGYYLDANLTQWLANPVQQTEQTLLGQASFFSSLSSLTAGMAPFLEAGALTDAIESHQLKNFIPAALAQILPDGGYVGAPADSLAFQTALANAFAPIVNSINTSGVVADPNTGALEYPALLFGAAINALESFGSPTSASGPLGDVGGVATALPGVNVITASATQDSALIGSATGSDELVATGAPTVIHGLSGTNNLIGGTGNTTLYGGTGANTYFYENASQSPNIPMTIVDPFQQDRLFVGATSPRLQ